MMDNKINDVIEPIAYLLRNGLPELATIGIVILIVGVILFFVLYGIAMVVVHMSTRNAEEEINSHKKTIVVKQYDSEIEDAGMYLANFG